MAERLSHETPFERLDPDQVSGQSFAVTRKGFDQKQVQAYLVSVSNQIKGGQQQIRDLREQVAQADVQSEPEASFSSQGVKLLDNGREASQRQTQAEAGEMATRARLLAEELQTTVEGLRSLPQISDEADLRGVDSHGAVEGLRSPPQILDVDQVAELLEQAYEQAQAVAGLLQEARDQAEAEVEHGRDQGREIVEQAKTLRLAVLRDMARRRQSARVQVERLRAGRDKLMATLSEARGSIDQSLESAKLSLTEAKVMANAAARRVEDEAEPTDLALLSELDDAQIVGMVPDVDSEPVARVQPVPVASNDVQPSPEGREAQAGVTVLSPVERDPVEAAADHPALTGDDGSGVDAIFARLRFQSENQREGAKNAAEAPVGED